MSEGAPKGEKMTADQRGNAIWTKITGMMKFIGIIHPDTPNQWRIWIIDQIKAAEDAARAEGREVKIRDEYDLVEGLREEAFGKGYDKGFAEAVEKVAAIADSFSTTSFGESKEFIRGYDIAIEGVVKSLRSLLPSEGGSK